MTTQPPELQPSVRPLIRRKVLGDLLEAHLRALPGRPALTVHRGEVDKSKLKTLQLASGEPDASRRVQPYVVLFDGTGPTDLEPDVAGQQQDLQWSPQITVAAAFSVDCTDAVDRVFAWVHHWSPTIGGLGVGRLEQPPGYDAGPPRPDRTVTPVRMFVPLQWQLVVTT